MKRHIHREHPAPTARNIRRNAIWTLALLLTAGGFAASAAHAQASFWSPAGVLASLSETGSATDSTHTSEQSDGAVDEERELAQAEAPEPAADGRVDEVVERIQQVYDNVQDFSADFTQEYTSVSLGETRTSEGHVYFKKPGMMRWDYRTPTERYLISDGANLWVYEPEFGQYYQQSLRDSQLPSALRFLMGEGELSEDFAVTLQEEQDDAILLELVPHQPTGQYARLQFVVSPASWQVVETTVFDSLGNTNRLVFSSVEQNAGLPDSGFNFTPPQGAVRIEAPEN